LAKALGGSLPGDAGTAISRVRDGLEEAELAATSESGEEQKMPGDAGTAIGGGKYTETSFLVSILTGTAISGAESGPAPGPW
jgi:hypothetical protein